MIARSACIDDWGCGATAPTSKIAQIAYCIHRTFMLSYYNRGSRSRENARMGNHEQEAVK